MYEKQKKARGRGPRLDGCPVHSTTETIESVGEVELLERRERGSESESERLTIKGYSCNETKMRRKLGVSSPLSIPKRGNYVVPLRSAFSPQARPPPVIAR